MRRAVGAGRVRVAAIDEGTFIAEYTGDIILSAEAERRGNGHGDAHGGCGVGTNDGARNPAAVPAGSALLSSPRQASSRSRTCSTSTFSRTKWTKRSRSMRPKPATSPGT